MKTILIFGGTTEGRLLAEALDSAACDRQLKIFLSVATGYGTEVLPELNRCTILQGPMLKKDIECFADEHFIDFLIDATHPYAVHISETLREVAKEKGLLLLRCIRKQAAVSEKGAPMFHFDSAERAAGYLAGTEGNILLTTGAKELGAFSSIGPKRLYARVLPTPESLQACRDAGIPTSHIIAMQGPFGIELNAALLQYCSAAFLVTKDGGKAGGFGEKVEAASAVGVVSIVIDRPVKEFGFTVDEILNQILG